MNLIMKFQVNLISFKNKNLDYIFKNFPEKALTVKLVRAFLQSLNVLMLNFT